ncbi:hypothetical protein AVEN_1016-1 [Araneus ventricosus]|uniref:Uncharacterized protein n=1 Tax=Araneus ventricosus TaxID=182803 RepID=A0A4Y2M815_ARAVE|nr:hypothetical protein AVEN_1016-1 [Araneus ventricosus]
MPFPAYLCSLRTLVIPIVFAVSWEMLTMMCHQGTVQSGRASVTVWDVCSWRDMGPLIRLETILTGDMYLSFLSDHLYSFMSIVHSDGLGQFQQDNGRHSRRRELLPSGSRNTLLILDTSIVHLNPQ